MSLYHGSTAIGRIYHGSTDINRVYKGSTLVWQKTAPPAFTNFGSTGYRWGNVWVDSNISPPGSVRWDRLFNGNTTEDALYFNPTTAGNGTAYIKFDFGYSRVVNGFKWYQSATVSHGTWAFEGSNDNTNWTQLDSTFTLTGGTAPSSTSDGLFMFSNTTAYRWYRLLHISGNRVNSPFIREAEFSIAPIAAASTSYANSGGTGNRTGSITVTATNITTGGGALSDLVDGTQSNEYWWTTAAANGTQYLTFDFGSARIVDAFKWYQHVSTYHGTWRWEGSNDNTNWTQVGTDISLEGTTTEYVFGGVTAYRYYRLRNIAGTRGNASFDREIEFRIS